MPTDTVARVSREIEMTTVTHVRVHSNHSPPLWRLDSCCNPLRSRDHVVRRPPVADFLDPLLRDTRQRVGEPVHRREFEPFFVSEPLGQCCNTLLTAPRDLTDEALVLEERNEQFRKYQRLISRRSPPTWPGPERRHPTELNRRSGVELHTHRQRCLRTVATGAEPLICHSSEQWLGSGGKCVFSTQLIALTLSHPLKHALLAAGSTCSWPSGGCLVRKVACTRDGAPS